VYPLTPDASFPPVLLDEVAIAAGVAALPRFGRVRYSVTVDSTNARALESLYAYDALGISFVTESQEAGRGRGGRSWTSPPAAGLLCSTILPAEIPHASLPAVGFWAALAIRGAVERETRVATGFKWPNDLLLRGRKCAGVLCEARSIGASSRVVVGAGINVNRPKKVPSELDAAWLTDGAGVPIDRTALLVTLLTQYEQSFDELLRYPARVIERWACDAALDGQNVAVRSLDGSTMHEGLVLGVGSDGALLLRTAGGDVRVTLGDVSAI
jgi:BirA family transcriptional regulator, biotin operon repressor / biotin---[acetyl-CoA-carboxylase] ligase